jgi:hypothetical protein
MRVAALKVKTSGTTFVDGSRFANAYALYQL